ncbi:MAG: DUF1553 domain-containing protein [Planctomycetes bacterium]|nr:DUF1553 domain-containing protein [Planctomycetota bacterium]
MAMPMLDVACLGRFTIRIVGFALVAITNLQGAAFSQTPPTPEQVQWTESKVRPFFLEHCCRCHGPDEQKGNLRLDSLSHMLVGGDSGSAITPGDPQNSLIVQAMRYEALEMPPTGKLPPAKYQFIEKWILDGAPWPLEADPSENNPSVTKPRQSHTITSEDRLHWSFLPVGKAPPPAPDKLSPTLSAIDAWINAQLSRQNLTANPQASDRELVRRVFVDLTGMPPSIDEISHWMERLRTDAGDFDVVNYEDLVDALLERPAYAEHWARHWLDVVRFAQSNGYERDGYKPYAWRYRDYVIDAFHRDKPYDRFVLEQLAGDELEDADATSRIATGFYHLGVWDDEPDDKRQAQFDELDDIMVTIGSAFLGLTTGCARCHDHKFDPIPQSDYYRMLSFLRNIRTYGNPDTNLDSASAFPIGDNETIRREVESFLGRKKVLAQAIAEASDDATKQSLQKEPIDANLRSMQWGLAIREHGSQPPATHILVRGSAATPGAEVQPGFLTVLTPAEPNDSLEEQATKAGDASKEISSKRLPPSESKSPLRDLFPTSGRRLQLAKWFIDPSHPLTARVMVNRIWHYHFGRGIVASTSDFGKTGSLPSHPELLDFLASEFIEHGWSIKHIHRLIMRSETYRRSSRLPADPKVRELVLEKDPSNQYLWRQNLRRMEAESIRDSMLAASGELNTNVGGLEMYPKLSGEVLAGQSKPGLDWQVSTPEQQTRRSIYAIVKRSVRDPLLETLDYSNTTSPLSERATTTVAPQALLLLNGRFTAERAEHLADLVLQKYREHRSAIDFEKDVPSIIADIYRRTLQRSPTPDEVSISIKTIYELKRMVEHMSERIVIRPDVPESLFSGYRSQLPGTDFLIGPRERWEYRPGVWGGGYEGIDVVDKNLGPHAFWNGHTFADGELRTRLWLDRTVENATIILRGEPDSNAWRGASIRLEPTHGRWVFFDGTRDDKDSSGHQELRLAHPTPVETWIPIRVQTQGEWMRVWTGENLEGQPLIEKKLSSRVPPSGRLGVAVWGGALSLDPLSLFVDGNHHSLARMRTTEKSPESLAGWTSYDGQWRAMEGGSLQVAQNNGAKLLWVDQPMQDGEISVEMKFNKERANIGGLIARVSDPKIGADNWLGYEISLNAAKKTLLFGEHRYNWTPIEEVPLAIDFHDWHQLRARFSQDRIQIFVDAAETPTIDRKLEAPLLGDLVGLRTWGSEIEYRNMQLQRDDKLISASWGIPNNPESPSVPVDEWALRQAIEAFCRSVFNLNEFVYVD